MVKFEILIALFLKTFCWEVRPCRLAKLQTFRRHCGVPKCQQLLTSRHGVVPKENLTGRVVVGNERRQWREELSGKNDRLDGDPWKDKIEGSAVTW